MPLLALSSDQLDAASFASKSVLQGICLLCAMISFLELSFIRFELSHAYEKTGYREDGVI